MSRRERWRIIETRWVERVASRERHAPLRLLMLIATRLADGWGLAILIPAALLIGGRSEGVAAVGLGTISAIAIALIVHGTKAIVRRRRPIGVRVGRPIGAPDLHAFPSGHTAHAFGMVIVTAWLSPTFAAITLGVACLVGMSRVFFCLHYPTDVLAGAAFGLAIAWLSLLVTRASGLLDWMARLAG